MSSIFEVIFFDFCQMFLADENIKNQKCKEKLLMNPARTRLRFSEEDDLLLLKEVVSINPFEDPTRWEEIRAHIENITGKNFKLRSIKEHTDLLVNNFLKKEKIMKDKSGIEEVVTEKDVLLTDLILLIKDFENRQKPKKKNTVQALREKGKEERDYWAEQFNALENKEDQNYENMLENDAAEQIIIIHPTNGTIEEVEDVSMEASGSKEFTPVKTSTEVRQRVLGSRGGRGSKRTLVPVRARARRQAMQRQGLQYLEEYDKRQLQIKEKQLELEERELQLQERQLEVEETRSRILEKSVDTFVQLVAKKIISQLCKNDT